MESVTKVVFKSYPDFSDNPRALFEYMKGIKGYDFVWIVEDASIIPLLEQRNIRGLLEGSLEALEAVREADAIITTSFDYAYEKRRDQFYICTWHGYPLKRIGFFDTAVKTVQDFPGLRLVTDQADIIVATSRSCQMLMAGMYVSDPRKVLITGYPRLDIMMDSDARTCLSELFDTEIMNSRLLLYMPTVRRGMKDEGAVFDKNLFNYFDYDPSVLDAFLKENNAYIVAKLHFADAEFYCQEDFKLPERVILLQTEDLTKHLLTIYHVLGAFELLITDYSSIFTEFMLLDKPVVFSCPDIDQYAEDRGFVVDDPTLLMPGPLVNSQGELLDSLRTFFAGDDVYELERERLKSFFHSFTDNRSSQRLFHALEEGLKNRYPDCNRDCSDMFLSAPLSQYIGRCEAEFFFFRNGQMTPEDSIRVEYNLADAEDDGSIGMQIEVDTTDLEYIRFDPDHTDRVVIDDMQAFIGDDRLAVVPINGLESDGRIVFSGPDPQIRIDLDMKHKNTGAQLLDMRFKPIDSALEGSSMLLKAYEERNVLEGEKEALAQEAISAQRKLEEVYASNSWKLTAPLRKLSSLKKER